MPSFNNTDKFIEKFAFDNKYFDPIHLKDVKVGFSVKIKYPENIRYKPAKKADGEADDVAIMWVVYKDESVIDGKAIVTVRISNFSRYLHGRVDYDFDDENSPTEDSVRESKASPKPLGLEYPDDFHYNIEQDCFFDRKNNELTGIDILNKVIEDHCDTIHKWKGLALRSKLYSSSKFFGVLFILTDFLILSLKIFGRTLEPSEDSFEYYYGYKTASLKKLKTNNLDVFGYKAPVVLVLMTFGILIAYIYYFFPFSGNGYEKFILENEILLLIHVVFVLAVMDLIIPKLLLRSINFLIQARLKLGKKKFKFP